MSCLVVCPPCDRPVADGDKWCAMHAYYFRVFLADPHWRNHEPPEPEEIEAPIAQGLMALGWVAVEVGE